jgi:hypothetical protein
MAWTIDAVTSTLLGNGVVVKPIITVITPTQSVIISVEDSQSQVTYDIGSAQVRQATLTVDKSIIDAGLLNPLTDRVYIRWHVEGGYDIPLFTGRVTSVQDVATGVVTVTCMDYMDDVNADQFPTPWTARGPYVRDEVTNMIKNVDVTFGVDMTQLGAAALIPVLQQTWEDDRVGAISQLMQGINGLIQSDRVGGFVGFINPFYTASPPNVATFIDGQNGAIITMQHTRSRTDIYNSITVIVERSDGSAPISVTAYDNDPSSRTFYGGPFGKRNKNVKLQTPVATDQAQLMAVRILRQSLALTETWQWSVPCNPLLDPGDVVTVWYKNVIAPIMIESITFPLAAITATSMTGRRLQLLDPSLVGIV